MNTIDKLGEDEFLKQFAERTITEYVDDVIENIGDTAFGGCRNLAVVEIPNATSLFYRAFEDCTSLKSISLPKIKSINLYAFQRCTMSTLDVGSSLTSINLNNMYFAGCTALETLILRKQDTICTLGGILQANAPIANGTGYIYVPKALVDSYKTATNWTTYASQFRALEDYTVDGTIHGELDESKI